METNATRYPVAVTSLYAMAAAMRGLRCTPNAETLHDLQTQDPLVPMYEITGETCAEEAESAMRTLDEICDRLRRLHAAYGEWREFDAGAYFDLTLPQSRRLVRVSERASTVHVTFFADLLLPTFRAVEHFWFYGFCPAYWKMVESLRSDHEPSQLVSEFAQQVQPEMVRLWTHVRDIVNQVRAWMRETGSYLIAFLCEEEPARWRHVWRQEPVRAIEPLLQPSFHELATLTLSTEFPLPARRQPGRLRRLRNNRSRGRPSQFLQWRRLDG